MLTIATPSQFPAASGACATIGNFDGVHLGHRALIREAVAKSRRLHLPCVVVTFWPHPLKILADRHVPPLLTSRRERLRLLEDLGVDITLELPFDHRLAALTAEDFVRAVLLPMGCRELVVGYDFSLGRDRMGNVAVLAALGQMHGFNVEQVPPVMVNDAVVSSSRMRDLLRAGDVWELQAIAGRFHTISGPVEHGYGRGVDMGYPTINVIPQDVMLPRNGVYATWAAAAQRIWPGVTNIGCNPTFGNDKVTVECHLLDVRLDLYEQEIALHFVQRLREERRFASPEELAARIAKDVDLARGILSESDRPWSPTS